MKQLEDRLTKANIDLDDFADLVWMRLQPSLESEVKRIMLETVDMALRDLRIVSKIEGTRR